MYNGIGLQTARGSGTNGHVQRNWAFVRPGKKDNVAYKTEEDLSKLDAAMNRQPNQDILDHERKRKIEVKCAEFEEILEKQGYSTQEIKIKVDSYRAKLMGQGKGDLPKDEFGRIMVRETHQVAEAQQEKNAKLREAFGISEYFVDGTSFDSGRRNQEESAKAVSQQQEKNNYREVEREKGRNYALVRTPSKEKEISDHENTSRNERNKKKKKKRERDRSSSAGNKKDKKKKSKKQKRDRSRKKKSKKHKNVENYSSDDDSDTENANCSPDKETKRKKKTKREKKKKERKRKTKTPAMEPHSSLKEVAAKHFRTSNDSNVKKSRKQSISDDEGKFIRGRSREPRETANSRNIRNINQEEIKSSNKKKYSSYNRKDRSSSKKERESETPLQRSHSKTQKDLRSFSRSLERNRRSFTPRGQGSGLSKSKDEKSQRSKSPKCSRKQEHESLKNFSDSRSRVNNQKDFATEKKSERRGEKTTLDSSSKERKQNSNSFTAGKEKHRSPECEEIVKNESSSRNHDRFEKSHDATSTKKASQYKNPFKSNDHNSRTSNKLEVSHSTSPFRKRKYSRSSSPEINQQRYINQEAGKRSKHGRFEDEKINEKVSVKKMPSHSSRRDRSYDSPNSPKTSKSRRSQSVESPNTPKKSKYYTDTAQSNKLDCNLQISGENFSSDSTRHNSRTHITKTSSSKSIQSKSPDVLRESKADDSCRFHYKKEDFLKSTPKYKKNPESVGLNVKETVKESEKFETLKNARLPDTRRDSSSSDLSYSPAQRNPERYRDILEQIEKEKRTKILSKNSKKTNRSPTPPLPPKRKDSQRSRSRSKDTKRSNQNLQPIVRLHSSTESEENSEEEIDQKNRSMDKFVEAVVNDRDEQQRIKEFELLEALKSDIAAKAKQKIKSIEKMANEISDPLATSSSGAENGSLEEPSREMYSPRPEKSPSSSISQRSSREKEKGRKTSRSPYSSSSSTTSGSSRSRSGSSRSSRSQRSSRSESSSSGSHRSHSRSRTASRSPSIPRRRGSPSFLDRRRITSARKRPIPYRRPTPSSGSSVSSYGSRSSLSRRSNFKSLSRSRSPSNAF